MRAGIDLHIEHVQLRIHSTIDWTEPYTTFIGDRPSVAYRDPSGKGLSIDRTVCGI